MNQNTHSDPVTEWLGAYLDGELTAERAAWVEAHLQGCPACQQELEALRSLTSLLHAGDDLLPRIPPAAAAVLPARAASPFNRLLRWLPLGLFGGWAFTQAVLLVTGGLILFQTFVPGAGTSLAWLIPGASGTPLLTIVFCRLLPQNGLCALLENFSTFPLPGGFSLISILISAFVAVLFLAWMALYWTHQRMQADSVNTGGSSAANHF